MPRAMKKKVPDQPKQAFRLPASVRYDDELSPAVLKALEEISRREVPEYEFIIKDGPAW